MIKKILSIIKTPITLTAWFLVSLTFTLFCIPLTFLPAPKRYENRFYFFLTDLWCRLLMFFSFIFIKVKGEENLPAFPNSPSIIIANHSSSLDIFLLETIAGRYPHIWLSKESYLKIPLFSILLKRMHVTIQREDSRSAAQALIKICNLAKNLKSHILIFPEGKRYDDGKIHDFNEGIGLLAKKLNRPVIPIFISGLNKIFPKKSLLIHYYDAHPKVIIGKSMIIGENETIEEFTQRVRQWFIKQI
jgi:1-acyl-sn-glycerol-3-phosphate acyltransferase